MHRLPGECRNVSGQGSGACPVCGTGSLAWSCHLPCPTATARAVAADAAAPADRGLASPKASVLSAHPTGAPVLRWHVLGRDSPVPTETRILQLESPDEKGFSARQPREGTEELKQLSWVLGWASCV